MLITSGIDRKSLDNGSKCGSDIGAFAGEVYAERDDNAAMSRLLAEAQGYDIVAHGNRRIECYMILKNMTSLWLLQTMGILEEVRQKVDLFATTKEDLLAKTVFVKLPNMPERYPSLDREPILYKSDVTVHLVLVGFSEQAEALAINAAFVAHYPNYCRDTRLRTRITIIDNNVFEVRDQIVQRYTHLFDNSYYRTIDLSESCPEPVVHRPMYEQSREDFVDIEWEFVNGSVRSDAVRQKLTEWSTSPRQQLTVAICHTDKEQNFNETFVLPETLYASKTPILCDTVNTDLLRIINGNDNYTSIYPLDAGYCDIATLKELKSLAKRVNYVYNHCFALTDADPLTAPSSIDEEALEKQWQSIKSLPKQYSNIFNAMTLGTKMHSVGHTTEDWDAYYALSSEEIEILGEVEHNRWSVEELILGYRPVTDEEQAMLENNEIDKGTLRDRKIHYDLRAFNDLRCDSTGKNVKVYDMVLTQGIPLIIKSCITN